MPMMATGGKGEGSDEFKSVPFRTSWKAGAIGALLAQAIGESHAMLGQE
jgi:hypothetical protein